MTDTKESITLKWGTIKGWDHLSKSSIVIVSKYYKDGKPMSAMMDRPDDESKEILCQLIDNVEEIYNDWTGKYMTKDEAKSYVREY